MLGWRSLWTSQRHPFLTGSAPAVRDYFIRKRERKRMLGWRSLWTFQRHPFLTGSAPAVRDYSLEKDVGSHAWLAVTIDFPPLPYITGSAPAVTRKRRMRAKPCAKLVVTVDYPTPPFPDRSVPYLQSGIVSLEKEE